MIVFTGSNFILQNGLKFFQCQINKSLKDLEKCLRDFWKIRLQKTQKNF